MQGKLLFIYEFQNFSRHTQSKHEADKISSEQSTDIARYLMAFTAFSCPLLFIVGQARAVSRSKQTGIKMVSNITYMHFKSWPVKNVPYGTWKMKIYLVETSYFP